MCRKRVLLAIAPIFYASIATSASADFDVVVLDQRTNNGILAAIQFLPYGKQPIDVGDTDPASGRVAVRGKCSQGDKLKYTSKNPDYNMLEHETPCKTPKVEIRLLSVNDGNVVALIARNYEAAKNYGAAAQAYSELYAFTGVPEYEKLLNVNVGLALALPEKDSVTNWAAGGTVASKALISKVEEFQKANGITDGGKIGSATLKALSGSDTWESVYAPIANKTY